jgi:hypothetical protein
MILEEALTIGLKYAFTEHDPFNLPLAATDQFDLGCELGRGPGSQ